MSPHRPGSPPAIRVTSRRPWPANCEASSGACWSRAAISEATTCGVCETSATARSCAELSISTGTEPQRATSSSARLSVSREVSGEGVSTQERPSKSVAQAASGPERSRPAIGCPPM